jgi:hypothetical protein
MDVHERRFLTADDRAYLDAVEVALMRVHGIPPGRAAGAIRRAAAALNRQRMAGGRGAPASLFVHGGPQAHAEALAALLTQPRGPTRLSLAALALLAAAAGLLGMRVVLGVVFRQFGPVRIGWTDVTLAVCIVGGILVAARWTRLWRWIGVRAWTWLAPVAGIGIGIGVVFLLRALHASGTLVTLPFWGAAAIAAACGALAWLFTWPEDRDLGRDVT